jgi:flagellar motility protein MotE (MotC chaperone)
MEDKRTPQPKAPQKPRFPLPRVRLLPLFILAGALMFGARVGSLWQKSSAPDDTVASVVQEQAFIPAALAESPATEAAGQGLGGEEIVTQGDRSQGGNPNAAFSQSEIQVLQQLAGRREAIEKRERELDQRLAVLSAAEAQIDTKIRKLREIQKTIEDLMDKHDEQEQKKIDNLVKIYQSMKPKDAARIFEQMDMHILVRVIKGMKERNSAAILAKMSADRANAVTAELATQAQLPPDLVGAVGVN